MAVNGLNYTSGNTLNFTTAGATRGLVDNTGKWGFGTLSPSSIVHISGATDPLTITGLQGKAEASILTIDGSGVVGTRGDVVVLGSITNNVITLTDSDSSTTDLTVDAITGLTIGSNVISYEGSGSFGADITVDALTSVSYSDWGINASGTGSVSGNFELPFITGGSYNAGSDELTLVVNGGDESNIVISGFEGSDTFVVGGAYDSSTGALTLDRNDSVQILISGDSWSYFETASILDNTITLTENDGVSTTDLDVEAFTGVSIASNVITLAGSHLSDDSVTVDAVTGGSFDLGSGDITVAGSGTITDISLGTDFVTGVTEANNVISVTKNGGSASDLTIQAVTAVTYNNDWDIALAGTGTIGDSPVDLPFITGGTYSNGTLTLVTKDGLETITPITGFEGDDTFVTGGTINSPEDGTLRLRLNDGTTNVDITNIEFIVSGDTGNATKYMGDNVNIYGGEGIVSVVNGFGNVVLDLEDKGTAGTYGSASQVPVFETDSKGQVIGVSESTIDITASQVSDFDTEVLSSVFEDANFVNSSEVDFTVTDGESVTAALIDGSIANARLVNSSINTSGTTGSGSISLGGDLKLISSDGSVVISDDGSGEFDFSLTDGEDTFVTGATLVGDTLTLTRNDAGTIVQSGFSFDINGDDSDGGSIYMGDTLSFVGGTGMTVNTDGATPGSVTVILDNTAVTAGNYGSASETVTLEIDEQGRITSASEQTIEITSSEVSDFDSASEAAIFQSGNFVDGTGIEFTVTANDSVSASLTDTNVSADTYGSSSAVGTFSVDAQGRLTAASDVNIDGSAIDNNTITFNGTTGSDPAIALNGTLDIISSDSSVVVSGGSGTLDIKVADSVDTNIYNSDGSLTGERTVQQSGNTLEFVGGDFEIDGEFHYNVANSNFGMGTTTPNANAILELNSTTQGFLFPRMTETDRGNLTEVQGLMVYQTDGDEGVYIYKSFGWVQVI